MTPFPRRQRAGAPAAILMVAALSGCGTVSSLNPFSSSSVPATPAAACPQAVILRPLANTAVFTPSAQTHRPLDVAFYGILSDVDAKCDFNGGTMRATLDVVVAAERGPASGHADGVDLNYFVAVTGPDQSILSKKTFSVHLAVPQGARRAAVTDHIEETINTGGRSSGDLTIDLGFQQPPEVVEFYRNFRGR